MTHTAKGITDKDFALARKIEEVVRLAARDPGRPAGRHARSDQRFAYIKYDA